MKDAIEVAPAYGGASPLEVEGLLTNPSTPGGWYGRKTNPAPVYNRVQGASSEARAGWAQPVGSGHRTRAEHRPAQPLAHRALGGWLG